jgi:hypothetical protein
MKKFILTGSCMLMMAVIVFVYLMGMHHGRTGEGIELTTEAVAAQEKEQPEHSPVKALKERDVYFPGTEDLAPDEMRVIACGTGMPNARPKQ